MKKILLSSLAASAVAVGAVNAQIIAEDTASNYGDGNPWVDGANLGTGWTTAWQISSGGTGFAGGFIGNPADAGITSMSSPAFGLFANPSAETGGPFVSVQRGFPALNVGDTFSVLWGVNFDSDTGNKGFSLFSGGGTAEEFNVNMGGFPGDITLNGVNTALAYGTGEMLWSFTHITPGNVFISATGRDGNTSNIAFSTTLAVTNGAPDTFRFYASNMSAGDTRQSYFNNPTVVPEPSTYALLTLGALALGGYAARRRARK